MPSAGCPSSLRGSAMSSETMRHVRFGIYLTVLAGILGAVAGLAFGGVALLLGHGPQ